MSNNMICRPLQGSRIKDIVENLKKHLMRSLNYYP
jgi:hypothetical protein